MRILTRYLLKAHIGPFFFALVALTGIVFINAVVRRFQDLAGKDLPASVIGEFFLLSLPHTLALTFPMAVLVAVLYAFAQLAADNEITALKASGTNLVRMIMPLLFAAFLFAGFLVWFNDRVLPEANHELKRLMASISAKTPTLTLSEGVLNPIRTQNYQTKYWLKANRIDDATQRLFDVVIYDLSARGTPKVRTIYADSGRMMLRGDRTDMLLTLFDGVVNEVDEAQPTQLQRVGFREQRVELKGVGTTLEQNTDDYRTDREMSVAMMQAQIDTARTELAAVREEAARLNMENLERALAGPLHDMAEATPASAPSIPIDPIARQEIVQTEDEVAYRAALDAQRLANQQRTLQDRINMYRVEIHKKFAIAVACIIFVLLGAPLAIRFPRGGVGMVIASSLAIFAVYYMSLIGGESLGDRGVIPPFAGPWAPNILFGVIALWALSRIGRETATSRGGGWDDLWLTLRGVLSGSFLRRGARRA